MNLTLTEFLKCVGSSILWLILNLLYGLFPLLLLEYVGSIALDSNSSNVSKEELNNLIRECSILFVCCVIMGAATIDLLFARGRMNKTIVFILCFLSFAPLVLVAITYIVLILNKNNDHNFNNLMSFQTVAIWYSCIFCVVTKSYLFINEEKNKNVR